MKRLIDAYSAKEALEYALVGDSASMAERVIDSQPTVDDVPVVRKPVVGSDGKEHMVCTGCRKQQDLTGVFSYCPNCGAKMDGGNDA